MGIYLYLVIYCDLVQFIVETSVNHYLVGGSWTKSFIKLKINNLK